jgi:hypothetical protein
MPRNEFAPNFCLMTDFDARPFTGTLYTAEGQNISLPSASQIIFDDPIQFLNGKGMSSSYSLKHDLEADKGGTWTISIDSQDRIKWLASPGVDMDITTDAGGGEIWGLNFDYYEMISTEPAIFPNDWQRGNLILWQSGNVNYGKINYSGAGTVSPSLYPVFPFAQDMISLLSVRSGNGQYCLQSRDEFYFEQAHQWILRDDGHVVRMSSFANPSFSWVDTAFRDRLGFSGNEQWISLYGRKALIADHVMPGVLYPSRPVQDHHISFDRVSEYQRKIGGGFTSNFIGNYVKSNLSFHLDAYADIQNDYRFFGDTLGVYFYKGAKINFFQGVGDPRLARITNDITSSNSAYSLTHTSENNGDQGVIRGTITNITSELSYDGMIRRRVPITMEIEHD